MATETLYIPEENLKEVITIIRAGIKACAADVNISESTIEELLKWCNEEEEYLNDSTRDDSKYDWSDEFDYER